MSTTEQLYSTLSAAQERFTYFLLGCAGAGMGLALSASASATAPWHILCDAAALLLWAASFFNGLQYNVARMGGLRLNWVRSRLTSREDPWTVGRSNEDVLEEVRKVDAKAQPHMDKMTPTGNGQRRLLILGAFAYVAGYVFHFLRP